mgnify:CR=1 FL=1
MITLSAYEYLDRALGEIEGLLESDKFSKSLDDDDKFFINAAIENLQTVRSFYRGK